jgi:hypothetical protein
MEKKSIFYKIHKLYTIKSLIGLISISDLLYISIKLLIVSFLNYYLHLYSQTNMGIY